MNGGALEEQQVLEALNSGLEIESAGLKFYSNASEEVSDPRGRQTLRYLADEEKKHLKFIKELKSSFEKNKEPGVKGIVKAHKTAQESKVFPKLEKFIGKIKSATGDKRILEEAEGVEKRSIAFYKDMAKEIKNRDYKEVFNILIREEEGHLMLVRQMADYMVLHGVWSGLEDYFANE